MKVFQLTILLTIIATSLFAQSPKVKVLVYVSSATAIPLDNGKTAQVGVFLGELTEPLEPLVKEGYELSFVSPDGNAPTLDANSLTPLAFKFSKRRLKKALAFYEELKKMGLSKPLKLGELLADEKQLQSFHVLFVPGGHAPMTDVLYKNWLTGKETNAETGKLLDYFHKAHKPTALICHGPGALGAAPTEDGKWIYHGYKMTCISNRADKMGEKEMGGRMLAFPTDILAQKGGIIKQTPFLLGSKVVEDRELITGQNPFSAVKMGKKLKKKIQKYIAIHNQNTPL